ncbi:hypothetical protein FT663_00381 [Candidozyma haemuli var. vulneris]|nr:hypothetical protein FT662_04494 [[Candida] haemuloni var. vulneris]KAF3995490.1 hypothetical protein FT663_00381 [[Candida] haemuloni var. vulneris]
MNPSYFYTHVPLDTRDGLVVFDQSGYVVYIAVGRWHTVVAAMTREFYKLGASPRPLDKNNISLRAPVDSIQAFLRNPGDQTTRDKIKYKYIFGTELQRKVWKHLENVPFGKTSTYSAVAAALGMKPSSVRVVANAVGANRLAVLVPCHRVLGRDGSVTGYRWGIDMKKELLEAERKGWGKTERESKGKKAVAVEVDGSVGAAA